jgi:hypothetical protein
MDVINLSLGEPEIEPSRDIVVQAIDGAARAGVVPCIAAGNDGSAAGKGSVGSPGNAPLAITAAASTTGRGFAPDILADFSSIGPTTYSLQLKPDVTAPGVSVVSSVPAREGTWAAFSGTSMASPHVAGAAALLREQHPGWTVAQIKSALMTTGDPAYVDEARSTEGTPLNEGGGRIDLPRANAPLFFAAPASLSFGLLKPGTTKTIDVSLTDAGGGAGTWSVKTGSASVTAPATVSIPGPLAVTATVSANASEGDTAAFVVLTRGSDTRRIAYWLHVERPKLGRPVRTLTRNGNYGGDTRTGRANVSFYRYPEGVRPTPLAGPEQVFAVRVRRVANFGVRVVSRAAGVKVEPRVVRGDDENRLTGYVGLPGDLNPYRQTFGQQVLAAGAILPAAGTYDVVFDEPSRASAGRFTFRLWVNDTTPPLVKVRRYARGILTLSVVDAGSGVDPKTLRVAIDGVERRAVYRSDGTVTVRTGTLGAGRHTVHVVVADYQEAKNMEDVPRILPNTRDVTLGFAVR